MEIIRFLARFFVSPTVSRHLGEMKTSTKDEKKWPSKAPSIFSEMVNAHLKYIYRNPDLNDYKIALSLRSFDSVTFMSFFFSLLTHYLHPLI